MHEGAKFNSTGRRNKKLVPKNNWYKRKANDTMETSPKKRKRMAGRNETKFGVGSERDTPKSEPWVVSGITSDGKGVGIEESTTGVGPGVFSGTANDSGVGIIGRKPEAEQGGCQWSWD